MLTVPLLISLLHFFELIIRMYYDDMPCALYHMLFAVVKGGKTLSSDVQICSRESVLLFLSIHSEKIKGMLLAAHTFDSLDQEYAAYST